MSNFGLITDPAFLGDAPIPSEPPGGTAAGQAEWPRMIVLDEDTRERLRMYLHEEIHQARAEREPLVDDWIKWQKQYWAEPESEVKNWPFPKAANIVVPVTAIATEAIHARMMNTLFSIDPFYSIRPTMPEWVEAAKPVEEWLETEVKNPEGIDMYGFLQSALLELGKLGTAIGKSGYAREYKKSVRRVAEGQEESFFYETHNGPTLDHVPLANYLSRLAEPDPQVSAWVGEEHDFTWSQLKRMAQGGRIDVEALNTVKYNYVMSHSEAPSDGSEYDEAVDKLSLEDPLWSVRFKIQEIWLSFDVDGDGIDEEIVVDFHWTTQTILSIRYNWYDDLHRPYRLCPYIAVENRAFGIGIGKQNEQFQEEITTIHRQRLDNSTLANMGMLVLKKNTGYGPKEPIFPGKMWFLDDVQNIQPLKLSETYNSAYANEDVVMRYSEMRTGVNEVLLGMPQEGTPGTATGDLTRLAEGNKRFDLVLKNVRRWLSQLGLDLVANFQQFGTRDMHWMVLGARGQWVDRVLQMPPVLVRRGALIEVTATNSITNREVEQRQWMALFQLTNQHSMGVLQLAGAVDPQLFQMLVMEAIWTSGEALHRLFQTFNLQDIDKLILGRQMIARMMNGANGQGGQGQLLSPGPGGAGGLPQASGPQGMGGVVGTPPPTINR